MKKRLYLALAFCIFVGLLIGCEAQADVTANFEGMTGEELRIAFLRGEISARDIFMASDVEYLASRLDALFRHYTEQPNAEFRFLDYEPTPDGLVFGEPFTLENCEILSSDASAETPIKLRYTIGDYYFYVGFTPFDMFVDTPEELSQVKWHLNLAYFVPISDGIVEPYAQFDTICIYIQENSNGRTLKAVEHATGYSIYKPAYISLNDLHITYNGKDKVAIQSGSSAFVVLDFSGALYHVGSLKPYLYYSANEYNDMLKNEIRWIDEDTLEGETERGIFHFTMSDYATDILHDDGTTEHVTLPGPIEYVYQREEDGPLTGEDIAELMRMPYRITSRTYPVYYWIKRVIESSISKYAIIDLDGDFIDETIIRMVNTADECTDYLIYHSDGQSTYIHVLYAEAFDMFKKDGTFVKSDALGNSRYATMVFEEDTAMLTGIAYSESVSSETTRYYIGDDEVTSEEYQKFAYMQSLKSDVVWYDIPRDYKQHDDINIDADDYSINGFDIRTIGDYPEIEAAIRTSIGKDSGELTRADFLSVECLEIYEMGIRDITPIRALVNLVELNASINNISDISPLSGLSNLFVLNLMSNDIVDISPLASLENLSNLFLDSNPITDISPLSELKNLDLLQIRGCNVADITPLSGLNLTDLELENNNITDITPLGTLTKLERLSISFNPISDISALRNLSTLLRVYCVDCPIADFSPIANVRHVEPYTLISTIPTE